MHHHTENYGIFGISSLLSLIKQQMIYIDDGLMVVFSQYTAQIAEGRDFPDTLLTGMIVFKSWDHLYTFIGVPESRPPPEQMLGGLID